MQNGPNLDNLLIGSSCYPDRQYSFNEVFTENIENHKKQIHEHAKKVLFEKQQQAAILRSYYNGNSHPACG